MTILSPLWRMCILLAAACVAAADSVMPSNSSQVNASEPYYAGQLSLTSSVSANTLVMILSLTAAAAESISPGGYSGTLMQVNSTNQMVANYDIIMLSCDPEDYPGNIQAIDIINYYLSSSYPSKIQAVVLYSVTSDFCMYNSSNDWAIYSTQSPKDATVLLGDYHNVTNVRHASLTGEIVGQSNNASITYSSNSSNTNEIAMIVLYTITGIITCLFLTVIIIGGVRAHRHPERYGPRTGAGGSRQSRARGLARAMLDTLPIVRFGDREGDVEAGSKPTPLEMSSVGVHGPIQEIPALPANEISSQEAQVSSAPKRPSMDVAAKDEHVAPSTARDLPENGISAAEIATQARSPAHQHSEECIICTDEFQVGQDQRVLPCNHRFHPACIDPWLLNVSGTCPLCRIDLNEPEEYPNGRDERDAALVLGASGDQHVRISTRRLLLNAFGKSTPDRMTGEERLNALRSIRHHQQVTRRSVHEGAVDSNLNSVPDEDDENRVRRMMRNVLHIRTRRTEEDQNDSAQQGPVGGPSVPDATSGSNAAHPPNSEHD